MQLEAQSFKVPDVIIGIFKDSLLFTVKFLCHVIISFIISEFIHGIGSSHVR